MGSKGSKPQRQNQHTKRLESKIRRFKKSGKSTDGLEKEARPDFKTGREADPRLKKHR